MITVFGNFEDKLIVSCVNATAEAEGEFGGFVTYTPCGGDEITVSVRPGRPRILGCIEQSFTTDPWVNVQTYDPCTSDGGFGDGPGPVDPDPDDPDTGDEGSGTGAGPDKLIIFTNNGNKDINPIEYSYDNADGGTLNQSSPLGAGQSHSKIGTVGYSFNTNIEITYEPLEQPLK
jgi:hypothetical protein